MAQNTKETRQKNILTGLVAIIKHADRKEKHADRNPNTPTEHGCNHKHVDMKLTKTILKEYQQETQIYRQL